ncbi:MAG: hypothetical protein EHM64_08535 [Ignavibacteriae bacterium]|nr:MAG: hypothetical protein EHM64_08535 [Ignavibacteriota bacterium]
MNIINKIWEFIRTYTFNKYLSWILFLVLTSIGIARALQQCYIFDVGKAVQHSIWWHIPFNLYIWWMWFFFVPVIYWTAVRWNKLHWSFSYLLFPAIIILIRQSIAALTLVIIRGTPPSFSYVIYHRTVQGPGIWVDLVVFFSIMIGVRVVEYKQQSERDTLKYSQLLARLAQSQLNALKSQLRPHFLFNTLNSLSTSIVLHENNEAKRMLSLIRNFLKTTIDESNQQEITFDQELRFINQYIEIEKVRYEDKLLVERSIAPETLPALVPSFLLLPLVENSINYAVAPKTADGYLKISSAREHDELAITIEDNGPGLDGFSIQKKSKKGVGIKITKERLEHLYKGRYTLQFENRPSGGLSVHIRLPYHLPLRDTGAHEFSELKEQSA